MTFSCSRFYSFRISSILAHHPVPKRVKFQPYQVIDLFCLCYVGPAKGPEAIGLTQTKKLIRFRFFLPTSFAIAVLVANYKYKEIKLLVIENIFVPLLITLIYHFVLEKLINFSMIPIMNFSNSLLMKLFLKYHTCRIPSFDQRFT